MPHMAKDARLELRVDPELKRRVDARAAELGQKTTTFVERALEKALSEAAEPLAGSGPTPAPVPSSEGVRSAACPRASETTPRERQGLKNLATGQRPVFPGVVRASSLVKQGVKPIPKKGEMKPPNSNYTVEP